jgi:hypothetical protein
MKKSIPLALLSVVLAASLPAYAGERLIPAGALIQCTVSEPKLSSKTEAVGDPVLCEAGYYGRYSHFGLPYQSYLVGRFEDYKDPGHFVGKGWMELSFDHIVIEPDTVVPINAKVVDVAGFNIDRQGRIHGKGHTKRDTVEWMIPILWPIDLINLPRRGPRPTLKAETRLTLKVMDDFAVPTGNPLEQPSPGLLRREPSVYVAPSAEGAPPVSITAAPDPQPAVITQPVSETPVYPADPYRPAYISNQPVYRPIAARPMPPPPRPVYVSPNGVWPAPVMIIDRNGYAYRVYGSY